MDDELITITKKEYERLLDAKLQLTCLEAGGVDNWDWYDDAMESYREKRSKLNGTPDE